MSLPARRLALAAGLAFAAANAPAFAQEYPPRNYQPMLYHPGNGHLLYRMAGQPWICISSDCRPLRFEGIADQAVAKAAITPLGYTERRFWVSIQSSAIERGRELLYACGEEGCRKLELGGGGYTSLGVFQIQRDGKWLDRIALLRRNDDLSGRSRLFWCAEGGCLEQQITRENAYVLAFMGQAHYQGRDAIYLRAREGWVLRCARDKDPTVDQLDCERTDQTMPDLTGALPPKAPEAPQAATAAGQVAARALPDIVRPAAAADEATRQDIARRLVAEARREARDGDLPDAASLLEEAQRIAPGLADIEPAKRELGGLKGQRQQRLRDRYQYTAAVEQAFATWRLSQAEQLIAEAEQRFPQDQTMFAWRGRLAQLRAAPEWQRRSDKAREQIAEARRALERGDRTQAERALEIAAQQTPSFPEVIEARRGLARAEPARAEPPAAATATASTPPAGAPATPQVTPGAAAIAAGATAAAAPSEQPAGSVATPQAATASGTILAVALAAPTVVTAVPAPDPAPQVMVVTPATVPTAATAAASASTGSAVPVPPPGTSRATTAPAAGTPPAAAAAPVAAPSAAAAAGCAAGQALGPSKHPEARVVSIPAARADAVPPVPAPQSPPRAEAPQPAAAPATAARSEPSRAEPPRSDAALRSDSLRTEGGVSPEPARLEPTRPEPTRPAASPPSQREEWALQAMIRGAAASGRVEDAERILDQAMQRYPGRPGWAEERRRLDRMRGIEPRNTAAATVRDEQPERAARAAPDRGQDARVRGLVGQARAAIARGDAAAAERYTDEAQMLSPESAEIGGLRGEIQRIDREQEARVPRRAWR